MIWIDDESSLQLDLTIINGIKSGEMGYLSILESRRFFAIEFHDKYADMLERFFSGFRHMTSWLFSDKIRNSGTIDCTKWSEADDLWSLAEGVEQLSALGFIDIIIKVKMGLEDFESEIFLSLTESGYRLQKESEYLKGLSYQDLAAFDEICDSSGPLLLCEEVSVNNAILRHDPEALLSVLVIENVVKLLGDRLSCFKGNLDRVRSFVHCLIENQLLDVNSSISVGGAGVLHRSEVCVSARGLVLGEAVKGLSQRLVDLSALA